ncbi:MAG: MFS transporter [Betaproteobacteria bacterium HGW-Betaproteobacteria-11]|nr:MAG: MFS transporter [Betaproteobacteria bacterium HGW-Betaproteobacteria-11]
MTPPTSGLADRNRKRFIAFRVLFNARFYYPVLAVLFLDLGLSATQYTLLNFAWAIVIVLAEVPSGALADRVGRRPLIVAAAICMVLEMVVLLVAPLNGGVVLLLFCLANRILSGLAEALASGADESLAYDSLAAEARAAEWPDVLADVMHWQSFGMLLAMLVGAAVYDPHLLNRIMDVLGSDLRIDQGLALRFPIALNLISAMLVLWLALGMREPPAVGATPQAKSHPASSWHGIVAAGAWILHTPVALFVILGGVLIDSVIRLFLTFGSVFFRLIDLPEASFGLIGAGMAGLGMLVSPVARTLARTSSLLRNFMILAALTLAGLVGVAFKIPFWGVLFAIPLAAAMTALGLIVSNTLNARVDAAHRATVLSFKGLVFNLGYGFASLLFALALRAMRNDGSAEQAFARAIEVLPLWLLFTLALLALAFRLHHAELDAKAADPERPQRT